MLYLVSTLCVLALMLYRSWAFRRKLNALVKSKFTGILLLVQARSVEELLEWMQSSRQELDASVDELRSLSRLLLEVIEINCRPNLDYPLFQSTLKIESVGRLLRNLEERLANAMRAQGVVQPDPD